MTIEPPRAVDPSPDGESLADVTVSDLVDRLARTNAEIGCNGKGIGSHPGIRSRATFVLVDPEVDLDLELAGIEAEQLLGCGCWSGIVFRLRVAGRSWPPADPAGIDRAAERQARADPDGGSPGW